MKLIELHYYKEPYSLNVAYIAAVNPKMQNDGCEVYMMGDMRDEHWNCDESYEEVLRLIKEASNG